MSKIVGKLRWYPGDALVEIKQEDLDKIAKGKAVSTSVDKVKGEHFVTEAGTVYEETTKSSLEEVTQTVVTILADTEQDFRSCVRQIIDKYRAPRAPYSTWGSDERAKDIIAEMTDEFDGWF